LGHWVEEEGELGKDAVKKSTEDCGIENDKRARAIRDGGLLWHLQYLYALCDIELIILLQIASKTNY
jgi:hypothetical protein